MIKPNESVFGMQKTKSLQRFEKKSEHWVNVKPRFFCRKPYFGHFPISSYDSYDTFIPKVKLRNVQCSQKLWNILTAAKPILRGVCVRCPWTTACPAESWAEPPTGLGGEHSDREHSTIKVRPGETSTSEQSTTTSITSEHGTRCVPGRLLLVPLGRCVKIADYGEHSDRREHISIACVLVHRT